MTGPGSDVVEWLAGVRDPAEARADRAVLGDALTAALPDGLLVMGEDGRVADVNARFARMAGRGRAELVGTAPPYAWVPEEHADGWRDLLARMAAEPEGTLAGLVIGPADRPVSVEARWARLPRTPDHGAHRLLLLRDVSEREAALGALSRSEERLQAVFAAMGEGLVMHCSDGHIVMANAAAGRILGLGQDEILGRTSMDPRWHAVREDGSPFPGEQHPAMVTLRTGEPCRGVLMGVDSPAHGERRWIQIASEPVPPAGRGGGPGVIVTFTDVTALRAEEERYRAAIAATRDGMIVVGPDARVRSFNPAAVRILGVEAHELVGADMGDLSGEVVDATGRPVPRMRRPMLATLATGRAAHGVVIGIDRPSDGRRIWVIESCEPLGVVDEFGRPAGALITLSDITELRRVEEALRAGEQRYRALFGYHADAVLRLSPDGEVLDASPSVWRVLRLDPNDLPADALSRVHPDDLPEAERAFARMCAGQVGVRFAARTLRGDGRWIWVEVTGGPVYDDTGALVEVQQSVRDVTDRVGRERDHAALERIGAMVVEGGPASGAFAAVAAELAAAVSADVVTLVRADGAVGVPVGHWEAARPPRTIPPDATVDLTREDTATAAAWRSGAPVLLRHPGAAGCTLAVPVRVGGVPWGCLCAGLRDGSFPDGARDRVVAFANLAALAVAALDPPRRVDAPA